MTSEPATKRKQVLKITRIFLCLLMFVSAMPTTGSAHFLWIASGSQAADGKVHVYFSESASPDDPDLLDRVVKLRLWQFSNSGTATPLTTAKDADSLVATPAAGDNSVFGLSHDYGVMSRGNETFLLKYHAKGYPSADPKSWRAVENAKYLPLEIVPHAHDGQIVLTILWQGKPLPEAAVVINGPGIETKLEAVADSQGSAAVALASRGLYSIRVKHVESASGNLEGKDYASIRHYATLSLSIGDKTSTATTSNPSPTTVPSTLPALEPGISSFGAAMIGDDLYAYGGHFGKPHHYSKQGQSDQLLRLNVKHPQKWEVVSTGPKRTGLAAVSHGGKFYRLGGFEARNDDSDKQSLWSMADFARFDPRTNEWEQLPSLPAGRSSHDALVIGDTLYLVGGWELQGEGNSKWHQTAYSLDLSSTQLVWNELPAPPFQRRALSLGEWRGKVYAIGGMQPEGGPTTATAVFDPVTQAWSDGPKLNGEPIEGFGSSAFLCAQRLCVTTIAGNVQVLADDGQKWVNTDKLAHPRFFHRMLPFNENQALVVGGASMQTGKIRELEILSFEPGIGSN